MEFDPRDIIITPPRRMLTSRVWEGEVAYRSLVNDEFLSITFAMICPPGDGRGPTPAEVEHGIQQAVEKLEGMLRASGVEVPERRSAMDIQ